MPLQEVLLCSLSPTTKVGTGLISLHDLQTGSSLASFKQSNAAIHCTSHVETKNGLGGIILTAQASKALLNVYTFQKDQLLSKIVLPEKLSCLSIDCHGSYCAAGTSNGRLYLWEIASGILFSAFEAHYRAITVLKFTQDGHALISGSEDSSISVWSLSRLLDEDVQNEIPLPYCSFTEHTLPITDIISGAGIFPSCRLFTASLDGTVKVWDLSTQSILTSIVFPKPITVLAIDSSERFVLSASQDGSIYQFNLFKNVAHASRSAEAIGGDGMADAIQISGDESAKQLFISVGQNITTLALSLNESLLLVGTALGQVFVYDVPSHQLLRSINTYSDKGVQVTYLSTLLKPPDLFGHINFGSGSVGEQVPVRPVAQFQKIKETATRSTHDIPLVLPICGLNKPEFLPSWEELVEEQTYFLKDAASMVPDGLFLQPRVSDLEAEVSKLKEQLAAAKGLNDAMWDNVVQKVLDQDNRELQAQQLEPSKKKAKSGR